MVWELLIMTGKIRDNGVSPFSNFANKDGAGKGSICAGHSGKTAGGKKKSFFAGGAFGIKDNQGAIEQRRQQGRRQASKIIMDQFAGDNKVTKAIEDCQSRQEEHKEDLSSINGWIGDIKKEKEMLAKEYGVEENSETAKNPEYQEQLKMLDAREQRLQNMADQELNRIGSESSNIHSIKQEALKVQGMVKSEKDAEAVLESVSNEIIGMIMDDAKEYMDEKTKEEQEKAEKLAEQTEEQKEYIENIKETVKENEAQVEELSEVVKSQDDLIREIEKIKKEQLLNEEDLKGLLINKLY